MHQSFVSTVPPLTGMGGDNDFSLFRALVCHNEALSDFPVLFKVDIISKDFSIKPSKFKYFLSLCELCGLYYQLLVSLI